MIFFVALILILIPVLIAFYGLFAFWSEIKGAPFVPTSGKVVREILKEAKLKPGQSFLELGSGDGRVTRQAVKEFGVNGQGIDIHPMLLFWSNLVAKRQKLDAKFKQGDLFKTDLSKADVIFIFLLPRTLKKLGPKILDEAKKDTLIISHGFMIPALEQRLVKIQPRPHFPTHFYKI
jgi:hypothetical protein